MIETLFPPCDADGIARSDLRRSPLRIVGLQWRYHILSVPVASGSVVRTS